jgi:hypothetical protein
MDSLHRHVLPPVMGHGARSKKNKEKQNMII